jgi:hypothetical protein
MVITPNGKARLMKTQQMATPYSGGQSVLPASTTPDQIKVDNPADEKGNLKWPVGEIPGIEGKEGDPKSDILSDVKKDTPKTEGAQDVSEYIYEKLIEFGYPPRKLDEHQDDFVSEKAYNAGETLMQEWEITIPNRYYGMKKRISNDDLQIIIKDVSSKFSMMFIELNREGPKISMKFNSAPPQSEAPANEEEAQTAEDAILDDVYGASKSSKEQAKPKEKGLAATAPKKKVASIERPTMLEMIASGREIKLEELLNA